MKFYKKTNGEWVVGAIDGMPAGTCFREIDAATGEISIVNAANGTIYHRGSYSTFQDENGADYASLAALKTASEGFFVGAIDDTDIVAALTTLNTSVNNSGGSQFKTFEVEVTRPANATPYTAGDVVADTTAAFLPILNVAKATGTGVKIIRCRIQTDDTGVAGKRFNLHLYKEEPTFIADNAPFAISYANATKRKGAIPIVMGTGNLGTVGMNDYNPIVINPTARDIFYMLEAVDAFTPSANSTKFTICIDCELSN